MSPTEHPSPPRHLAGVVVLDVETTSLDPVRGSILEIGAVPLLDIGVPPFEAECRPHEGALIEPEALRVNGGKLEDLLRRPRTEAEIVLEFRLWLARLPVAPMFAGFNVAFDVSFIAAALVRAIRLPHRTLDVHAIVAAADLRSPIGPSAPAEGWSSDRVWQRYGLGPEPRPHRALEGAQRARIVLSREILRPEWQ